MTYVIQIADPEGLHVTIQCPGVYNPDILEDVTARCGAAYRQALSARAEIAPMVLEPGPDDEEIDGEALLRALQSFDDDDDDDTEDPE